MSEPPPKSPPTAEPDRTDAVGGRKPPGPPPAKHSDFLSRAGLALLAGLPILPGAVGVAVAFVYFANWPVKTPQYQLLLGMVVGAAVWLAVSCACLRGRAEIENADGAAYNELVGRTVALQARIDAHKDTGDECLNEARKLTGDLAATLGKTTALARPGLGWLGGSGYISLWRELHRAEEALLQDERKEWLYATALTDESRLEKAAIDDDKALLNELRGVLGEPNKRRERAAILADLDEPEQRALLRTIRYVLNSYRDDLFQKLVQLRNRMFVTLIYTGLVGDGVLVLAILVLNKNQKDAVVAALTYYLVGALVGLFAELYGASRGQRAGVHDYGLGVVRVLTIPVLSGIAAVGGVVITRLGGTATDMNVTLDQIFSLKDYPFGVIVAAIFGLTPGLLLERLRAETDAYKKQIVQSGPGAPSA